MPREAPERRWPRIAGFLVFVGFVALATVPAYTFVGSGWRALVVRLAATLVLGVFLLRVHKTVARRVEQDRASAFDAALAAPALEARVDPRLVDAEAGVRSAVRNRWSFERVLWPRLVALARAPLIAPRSRRFGRGPSLEALGAVIDAIERQR